MEEAAEQAKVNLEKMNAGTLYKCSDSNHDPTDFFQFFPVLVGVMKREQQTLTYSGQCFEKIDI